MCICIYCEEQINGAVEFVGGQPVHHECLVQFDEEMYGPEDTFRDDVEADADTLRSAGMGTDEDYGLYYDDSSYDFWGYEE